MDSEILFMDSEILFMDSENIVMGKEDIANIFLTFFNNFPREITDKN